MPTQTEDFTVAGRFFGPWRHPEDGPFENASKAHGRAEAIAREAIQRRRELEEEGKLTEAGIAEVMEREARENFLPRLQEMRRLAESPLQRRVEELQGRMQDHLDAGDLDADLAREIRAHVKSLKEEERTRFVFQAHSQGDLDTLRAVLGAPAYLSGLQEDTLELVRKRIAEEGSPEVIQARDEAVAARRKVGTSLSRAEDIVKEIAGLDR